MEKNLQALRDQLPVKMTYGSESHNVYKGEVRVDRLYVDAGRIDQYQFSVGLVDSEWSSIPPNEGKVTIDGTTYRVLAQGQDAAGIGTRLDLGPEYAGE